MRLPLRYTSPTYMIPSKSMSMRRPFMSAAGVYVFTYQPSPISLKPRAERRDLKLDAPSELSSDSLAAGATHG